MDLVQKPYVVPDGADEKFGLAATLSLGAVVYRKVIWKRKKRKWLSIEINYKYKQGKNWNAQVNAGSFKLKAGDNLNVCETTYINGVIFLERLHKCLLENFQLHKNVEYKQ